jgi:hypothetical protein
MPCYKRIQGLIRIGDGVCEREADGRMQYSRRRSLIQLIDPAVHNSISDHKVSKQIKVSERSPPFYQNCPLQPSAGRFGSDFGYRWDESENYQ